VRSAISTAEAPPPVGRYSQGYRRGDTVWVSGQVGVMPPHWNTLADGIAAQTRYALEYVEAILLAGGATWSDVTKLDVYLVDASLRRHVDVVMDDIIPAPYPARTAVGGADITEIKGRKALVEIAATAVVVRPSSGQDDDWAKWGVRPPD
jgi:2-iminobutanoate/2-iminopropanoate deaminase